VYLINLPVIGKVLNRVYSHQVFGMTMVRGTALIINNEKITNFPDRPGSEVDVQNLSDMLRSFQFNIESKTNLTAEVAIMKCFFFSLLHFQLYNHKCCFRQIPLK